jgi:RNA polymerase sigma-70 factor (ECF subfamily)
MLWRLHLSHEQDYQLLREIATGDRRAFRALAEKYSGPLYRFILRQLGRPAVAEELLQETLLRAYRAAATFEPRAAVSTWLFRIAANLCLNEAQSAHFRHEVAAEAPGVATTQADPATALERKEVGVAVEAALTALPPQQRAAVQLARFEGLSYAEIAEVLGVSVGAVDGLLQRARQTLRKQLHHLA